MGVEELRMYLSLENEISTQSYYLVKPEKKSKFIEAIFEIFIADQCICLINKNGNCTAAKKFSSKKIVTETINFSQRRQSSAKSLHVIYHLGTNLGEAEKEART